SGKKDIQSYITQAKTDLTKIKDDSTEDITTTANNAKTSVQDTASIAVNSINTKTTEATEHVDSKVTEFNQTVAENGFLSPQILDEKLRDLEWQKHKLTKDDGTPFTLNKFDFNDIDTLETGNYFLNISYNSPFKGTSYGFLKIEKATSNSRKAIATPGNSNQYYVKYKWNGTWSDWEEVNTKTSDTGWVPFTIINGGRTNPAYDYGGSRNGYGCAYRAVTIGSMTQKFIRVNADNVAHNQIIAQLPANFAKSPQVGYIRAPLAHNGTSIIIENTG